MVLSAISHSETQPKTRAQRVFAFAALASLVGCQVNPARVAPLLSPTDYSKLTCDELATLSDRIRYEYRNLRGTQRPGIRIHYARMNGVVIGVNDAIRINGCKLPSVRVPNDRRHERK
jgi:hypothetical protein